MPYGVRFVPSPSKKGIKWPNPTMHSRSVKERLPKRRKRKRSAGGKRKNPLTRLQKLSRHRPGRKKRRPDPVASHPPPRSTTTLRQKRRRARDVIEGHLSKRFRAPALPFGRTRPAPSAFQPGAGPKQNGQPAYLRFLLVAFFFAAGFGASNLKESFTLARYS